MKKWVIIGGAIVVVVVVFLIVGISNLGPIIEKAVNTYGPRITKTDVHLENVRVSVFSGQAKLQGFSLGNPEGFNTARAIEVGSIYVDLDEGSLTDDTIVVEKILVEHPRITYEKARKTDNFQTILANVKEAIGEDKSTPTKEDKKKGGTKTLLVRDFVLRKGKVNLAMTMLPGKSVSASIPDIHLKNVGGEGNGATPSELAQEILTVIYAKIASPSVRDELDQALKKLDASIRDDVEGIKAAAEEKARGVGETAKEDLQKAAESTKKDLESKVKGLFGE